MLIFKRIERRMPGCLQLNTVFLLGSAGLYKKKKKPIFMLKVRKVRTL